MRTKVKRTLALVLIAIILLLLLAQLSLVGLIPLSSNKVYPKALVGTVGSADQIKHEQGIHGTPINTYTATALNNRKQKEKEKTELEAGEIDPINSREDKHNEGELDERQREINTMEFQDIQQNDERQRTGQGAMLSAENIRKSGGFQTYENIRFSPPDCRKKLLVYVCDRHQFCGGLADRQKGIISTFILAQLTNRTFVIDKTDPCNIEEVLPPNLYDWAKCREVVKHYDHKNDTQMIHTFLMAKNSPKSFKKDFERYNGTDMWTKSVVKLRVNSRLHLTMKLNEAVKAISPWLFSKPEEDLTKHTMELLFKHSVGISNGLQSFKDVYFKDRYIVCAHLRVGIKEGPFLITEQILDILVFLGSYISSLEKPYVLYIASDSDKAKLMAKLAFPHMITLNSHSVEHLDKTRDSSCSTTFDSVLEQAILSQCNTILMTGSGYSRMAVLVGGKAQHIFMMHGFGKQNKNVSFYTRHSLAEAFSFA